MRHRGGSAVGILLFLMLTNCEKPRCPEGLVYSEEMDLCTCMEGFIALGGMCVPLDAGVDGSTDASTDAAEDALPDASSDAPSDAPSTDVTMGDSGVDAGDPCASCSGATPRCVDGRCVECTPMTEMADCSFRACDPALHVCAGERGSRTLCDRCVSDSECSTHIRNGLLRCVPMTFQGMEVGSYCLIDREARLARSGMDNCPPPYAGMSMRTSVSGHTATYCVPDENRTTCASIQQFPGLCFADEECGLAGLDDALCIGSSCTYTCTSTPWCPSGDDATPEAPVPCTAFMGMMVCTTPF